MSSFWNHNISISIFGESHGPAIGVTMDNLPPGEYIDLVKSTGASGVVHKGNGVQIIYGPRVTVIKSNLEDYLENAPEEEFVAEEVAEQSLSSEAENKADGKAERVVKTVVTT